MQEDVRSAAVGGRRGDPRRQGQRSGSAGALRNLWQNMWRNNGEGESSSEQPAGYQVCLHPIIVRPYIRSCVGLTGYSRLNRILK